MVKRIGRARRKTRHKYKKTKKTKGKISLTNYLQKFKKGDKVHLTVEPAVHKGLYFRRFVGKMGEVKSSQGRCYKVEIKDGGKSKMIIVHPVHLKKARGEKKKK